MSFDLSFESSNHFTKRTFLSDCFSKSYLNRCETSKQTRMFEILQPLEPTLFWVLCAGFIVAFLLAFSVGANDVSNSFGTSVGSGVLTVTQACLLATFFEVAGATLLGYSVCDTFRRSVYDVTQYEDSQKELMLGALACLVGSAAWNLLATALKMPISGTHSIVGATIGFSIVLRGWGSIKWMMILRIVGSWFASPVLSGIVSSLIYILISKTIIRKIDPLKYGLKSLPLFYGSTIFINVASVVISGPAVFGLDTLAWYTGLLISLIVSGIAICCVALILVPKTRRKILDDLLAKNPKTSKPGEKGSFKPRPLGPKMAETGFDNKAFKPDIATVESHPPPKDHQTSHGAIEAPKELTLDPSKLIEGRCKLRGIGAAGKPPIAPKPAYLLKRQQAQDQPLEEIDLNTPTVVKKPERLSRRANDDIEKADGSGARPSMISGERFEVYHLFSSLQILTACFASFAHGTNDVSNAVAPLIPVWNIYSTGQEDVDHSTQIWILAFGGIGICTGLWAWGRAVMGTVGNKLTQLTPSKGFAIELGAAISVLCATKLGLPISTTHCKVGSVVIVGLASSRFCSQDNLLDMSDEEQEQASSQNAVDWKLFGNIAITWIVTVPLAGAASATVMLILKWLAL